MSLTTMRRKFKRADKYFYWVFIVIFGLSAFTLYGSYTANRGAAAADDSVVAKVNGEVIPRDLFQRYLEINRERMQMRAPNTPANPETEIQIRAASFDMAENDTLRAQLASQQGVSISESEAQAEQKKVINQLLAGKMDGLSAEDKQQQVSLLEQRIPLDVVKRQLLAQGLQKKIQDETKPTDADLMKSFQEYKARHILIKTDTRSDAEARRMAQDILSKLQAGQPFDELAKKYSEDPGSKTKGGDLGWVGQKTGFVPEFKEALLKLDKGQVSPLVKTTYGYHIIKVDDTRTNLPKDINKPGKKAQYLKDYTDQLVQEKLQALMSQAQKNAKVEAIDPFVKGYLSENDMLEAQQKGNIPLANAKRAEAIAAYEKAAVGRSGGPVIYTKLSELYQQAGQDQKAVAALQQSLVGRTDPQLAWQLGQLLMKSKKNAEAIAAFQKASDVAYDMPWLRPQLVQQFKALNRPDLAAKEQAKWEKWQKDSINHPQQVHGPGGETLELQHTQTNLSPEELKKFKKSATVPVTVK
jgi:parvulin-like peptidyl-prolyl isomerase